MVTMVTNRISKRFIVSPLH